VCGGSVTCRCERLRLHDPPEHAGYWLLATTFLVVLALAWAGVFLPAVWRASQRSPLRSTQRFAERMKLISPPGGFHRLTGSRRYYRGGRRLIVSRHAGRRLPSHRRSQRQRTWILLLLGALVPSSAAAAVLAQGHGWWEIHIACDFSFALYVALLLEAKKRRDERLKKVRPLATRGGLRTAGQRWGGLGRTAGQTRRSAAQGSRRATLAR
jgi:hypothetical protein